MAKPERSRWQIQLGIICVLSTLTACQTTSEMEPVEPTSYTSRHPIVVTKDVVHLKVYGQGGKGQSSLSHAQRRQIQAFLSDYKDTGTGSLKIKSPSSVVHDVLAAGAVAAVRRIAEHYAIPRYKIRMVNYYPRNPRVSSPVIISYRRHAAIVHKCGEWPESNTITYKNRPSWSFGCATQTNLAAMVANPSDLIEPRRSGPADAQRRDTVIAKYRSGEITSASKDQNASGSVSEVAK